MSASLLITTGHNSSAILVEDGTIVCGYEQERLSGIKSDSRYPADAIDLCLEMGKVKGVDDIYVSHWDPLGDLTQMKSKYWRPDLLPSHKSLHTLSMDFSHHDAHAHGALWYAESEQELPGRTLVLVCDGFGNFGEHISIYQKNRKGLQLLERYFGYEGSLGLMYQYMTAYLGMKMHEDEYKLLGYEAHIHEVDVDLIELSEICNKQAMKRVKGYFNKNKLAKRDPVLALDALPGVQKDFIDDWDQICKKLAISDPKSYRGRVILSYMTQTVLEAVMVSLLQYIDHDNLVVAGGVFYNVKLNKELIQRTRGKFCAFPLAGDQGGAIGLFHGQNPGVLKPMKDLFWGVRPKMMERPKAPGFVYADQDSALPIIIRAIERDGFCNLVRGAMEFGPRALCNTSTIAIPQMPVVEAINRANGRNTIMPMAPVMDRAEYMSRFLHTDRVWKSEKHMIVALPYAYGKSDDIQGAAHLYGDESTGRPQVIDLEDLLMQNLLDLVDSHVLINTSFNVHGVPIVLSARDAINSHMSQRKLCPTVTTVYIEE